MSKKKRILGCSVDGFSFKNPLVRDYVADNCRNVYIKRPNTNSEQSHDVFLNQSTSSAVITRKFALLPDTQENKVIYRKIKNSLVKFRDLENTYVNMLCEKVKNGQLDIQTFSGTSTAHVKPVYQSDKNNAKEVLEESKSEPIRVSDVFILKYGSWKIYRNEFLKIVESFKEILERDLNITFKEDFIDKALHLLDSLLAAIKILPDSNYFIEFYKSLPVKAPKFLAGSIIHILLDLTDRSLKISFLAKVLGIQVNNFSRTNSFVVQKLRSLKELNHIKPIKSPYKFNSTTYCSEVHNIIVKIFDVLGYSNEFTKKVIKLFNSSLNLIDINDSDLKVSKFYESLPETKNPCYIAAVYSYVFLRYSIDSNIFQKNFLGKINGFFDFSLKAKVFSPIYSFILEKYIIIEKKGYHNKVKDYIIKFLKRVEDTGLFITTIPENAKDAAIELFDLALKQGYDIAADSVGARYNFPQFIAISLIYFSLKQFQGFFDLKRENLKNCIGETWDYSTATTTESPIYPYISENIPKLKKRTYTEKNLEDILSANLYLDTIFLLNLFRLSKLNPQIFASKLGIYGGSISEIVKFIKRKSRFSDPEVFDRIEIFIKNFVDVGSQYKLLQELNKLRMIKAQDFLHRSVRYCFRWNVQNCNQKSDTKLGRLLCSYMKAIIDGGVVVDTLYEDHNNLRCSDLKIKGTNKEPLKVFITEPFIKKLVSQRKIKVYEKNHPLSTLTNEVFEEYLNKEMVPGHNEVLPYILLNNKDSIAIEVPISKQISDHRYFIGHIDLIQITSNKVVVLDYKPSHEPMITSLPQIISYGLMIKENFELFQDEVLCISFNEKQVWEFNPNVLIIEVIKFLKELNLSRDTLIDLSWSSFFV